jgi:hypothetical protein
MCGSSWTQCEEEDFYWCDYLHRRHVNNWGIRKIAIVQIYTPSVVNVIYCDWMLTTSRCEFYLP